MKRLPHIYKLIKFELGNPFKPFQQLLGCLPPASRKLLPSKYEWLMTSSSSPVLEFYPEDFAVDMTHKKNPWECTVLLPFIDEKKLLEAESKFCPLNGFSQEEIKRNSFGNVLIHNYDPNVTETYYSTSHEIGFQDIHFCQSRVQEYSPSLSPGAFFRPQLIEGAEIFLPGFPTLTSLKIIDMELSAIKINVFGSESRYKTLTIEIDSMKVSCRCVTVYMCI
jgi:5'-3' exoribonuclease 1